VSLHEESIKKLYANLNLKSHVLAVILKAHEKVLEYGLSEGKEMAIAIDTITGEVVAKKKSKSSDSVKLDFPPNYKRNKGLVLVHNHPKNSPFSYEDLFSFGKIKFVKSSSVQCHSGVAYNISKGNRNIAIYEETELKLLFVNITRGAKYKNLSFIERVEEFNKIIANKMGWSFEKGGGVNG